MPIDVLLTATAEIDPDEAFHRLADYKQYPRYTPTVRSVEVFTRDVELFSTWEVDFRGGILRWTERDTADPPARVLTFEQVDGDLAAFVGSWSVRPTAEGSLLSFAAVLDLGMPSLAAIVDPVAKQALTDNMCAILEGLFADARLRLQPAQALAASV